MGSVGVMWTPPPAQYGIDSMYEVTVVSDSDDIIERVMVQNGTNHFEFVVKLGTYRVSVTPINVFNERRDTEQITVVVQTQRRCASKSV